MIQIAVCDNEEEQLERTLSMIGEYFMMDEENKVEITSFLSSHALAKQVERKKNDNGVGGMFQIYILDVMMPDIDGITLGKIIRRVDTDAVIIYTTSYEEFAFEAFGVHALDYLKKPLQREKVIQTMQKALAMCKRPAKETFPIKIKSGIYSTEKEQIVYVENVSRSNAYHLSSGQTVTGLCNRGKFEDAIMDLLNSEGFIQVHKSYVVNMQYIKDLTNNSLVLDDGTEIPVSKKRKIQVKKDYLKYLSSYTLG